MSEEIRLESNFNTRQLQRAVPGTRPTNQWRCEQAHEHFVMYVDGLPVSMQGIVTRDIELNGRIVTVGGLAYGATRRGFERQGRITRLQSAAFEYFKRKGIHLSALTCLDTLELHYQKLGWKRVMCPVRVTFGEVPAAVRVFIKAVVGPTPVPTSMDLRGLPW